MSRSSSKARCVLLACAVTSGGVALQASAAPIGSSVVVERIGGDGSFEGYATADTVAQGTAVPVFLDEFSLLGGTSPVQTIGLPTVEAGSQQAVTEYYRVDSFNGYLGLSADGQYLLTTGYNAPVGTPDVISSTEGGSSRRPLARISLDGTVDTETSYRWSSRTSQRSVASPDGVSGFYIVTASSAQGTRYVDGLGTTPLQTPSASAGRIVSSAHRVNKIYDDKLFVSTGSINGGPGLFVVDPSGSSLPTASTSPDFSLPITAFATTAGGSPEQFVLLDEVAGVGFAGTTRDVAYIANSATDAGLQKWVYDSGTDAWTQAYTLADGVLANGLLGLEYAGVDGTGASIFYATTAASIDGEGIYGNQLVRITDLAGVSTTELISQSPDNTVFRGVVVVPEPATLATIGLCVGGLLIRRRR